MAFILRKKNRLENVVVDKGNRSGAGSGSGSGSGRSGPAAPLLSISVGTAGADRNARFLERMGDAGRMHRVQSAVFYDYNENTTAELRKRLNPKNRGGSVGTSLHTPKTIRTSDGFLLNPYAFGEYLGIIDRDMEELLEDICGQAHDKGYPPQLIVEFLGFGGHANLGLLLHRKIREAFPEARCLPVIALPSDQTLQEWMRGEVQQPKNGNSVPEWMRNGTWNSYESHLTLRQHEGCLLVDNAIDSPPNDNLAMGLATIEAAGTNAMKPGSLSEALAGIRIDNRGWLGMNVVQRVLPSRRAWTFGFPMRRLRPVWGSDDELAVQVKMAVKQCLNRGSLLERWQDNDMELDSAPTPETSRNGHSYSGNGQAAANANGSRNGHAANNGSVASVPRSGTLPRIYVTAPIPPNLLKTLENNVRRQLKAEGFEEQYGNISICFGAASFQERPDENESRQELPKSFLGKIGSGISFVVLLIPRLLNRMVAGSEKERKAKQLKTVAVSLYPIHGEVKKIIEILHPAFRPEDTRNHETGFGTYSYTSRPERGEVQHIETGFGTGYYTPTPDDGYTMPAEVSESQQPVSNGAVAHEILEDAPEPDYATVDTVEDEALTAEVTDDAVQTEAAPPTETAALENGAVPGGAIS